MKFLRGIIKFFNQHFSIFLILIVLISYGQMLGMQPWEDDNALFVKLSNVQARVGYFGVGPLGEGVYKYAAVPFIPIYHFFGYNTVAYFSLLILLYILATITIYKVFSYVLGKTAGRVSGFLFACGYVTSDSFWRMANSATTSITIIIISLFIGFYWKYYKEKKNKWYFVAFVLYFLSVQYSVVRDHYLFAIAVFFELIFLTFQRPLKSIFNSFIRLIPFTYIFLRFVIFVGDARTGGVKNYIFQIIKGNYGLTSGFFSSVCNLIVPNYLTDMLFELQRKAITYFQFEIPIMKSIVWLVPILALYLLFRPNRNRKRLFTFYCFVLISWIVFANHIFLSSGSKEGFASTFGVILILLMTAIFFVLKETKKVFALFSLWVLVNVFAYSSSFPTIQFETINRYLAHSFFALTALIGILYSEQNNKTRLGKFVIIAIVVYGLSNIFNSVIYQRKILIGKSFPVKKFYQDLRKSLPVIAKGDILYFDVSSDAQGYYRDAISAAMIPDSGSFGWRYNIDRYDFRLVTDFNELSKIVKDEKIDPTHIHSYWYSNDSLIDTSNEVRNYFSHSNVVSRNIALSQASSAQYGKTNDATNWAQPDLEVDLPNQLDSVTPQEIELTIVARPIDVSNWQFPIFNGNGIPGEASPWKDETQKNSSLEFKREMDLFLTNSKFSANSYWQDREVKNIYDNDVDTFWQSDRLLWQQRNDYVQVELPGIQNVDKIMWVAGSYSGGVPISYTLLSSLDGANWSEIKRVSKGVLPNNQNFQVINFSKVYTRYVKMIITETYGGDSPMISEFRVIPSSLSELNPLQATHFIEDPYLYVINPSTFLNILKSFNYKGLARLNWMGNKEVSWLTNKQSEFSLIYDGQPHSYRFTLPAGGTKISKIKITDIKIPGTITISNVKFNSVKSN